jgi:succinyl-diaminopimelate desuccinylase
MDVDIRYLPNQDPGDILAEIGALGDVRIVKTFQRAPARVSRRNLYVRALREAVSKSLQGDALSVGRDGASDAISFLEAGVPAVEFGPTGGGHHGPEEWVSISSLRQYRQALRDFVVNLPGWLVRAAEREGAPLRAVEGGLG